MMQARNGVKPTTVDANVRLIKPPIREPATVVERSVVTTLNNVDTISLTSLVERVARDLYKKEVAIGAAILDIGLLGPDLLAHDVAAELVRETAYCGKSKLHGDVGRLRPKR
jgi:hypothetical protein